MVPLFTREKYPIKSEEFPIDSLFNLLYNIPWSLASTLWYRSLFSPKKT
jgi:hypothetical protein